MSASVVRRYTEEIHAALGYWPTWLPGVRLGLGDCGPLDGRVFKPTTSLEDLGITFDVDEEGDPTDIQYASEGAVEYRTQLKAGNQAIPSIPQGTAGLEVTFARQHAVVLVARDGRIQRIANIHALGKTLLERVERGDLPRDYAIVTELVTAAVATVLISSGGQGGFAIEAQADLTAGLLDLASVDAGVSRVSSRNIQTEVVAAHAITPLFRVVGFKREGVFWGRRTVVTSLGFDDDDAPGDLGELVPGDADDE